jgi:hypothetical protein
MRAIYPTFKVPVALLLAPLLCVMSGGRAGAVDCTPTKAQDLAPGCTLEQALCGFDAKKLTFAGTPRQQAACLLRKVERGRSGFAPLAPLPPLLGELLGCECRLPAKDQLKQFLAFKGIDVKDIGGSPDDPVSTAIGATGQQITARYFVIHDTSAPNCSTSGDPQSCPRRGAFPPAMNEPGWKDNQTFNGFKVSGRRVAHVMTNRVGGSFEMVDFKDRIRAVKFELCHASDTGRNGLFLHVENIQPRIASPPSAKNDVMAPDPGFSKPQYERLALLYIAASVRKGEWLIPAFHGTIDCGYAEGHDDPQNFSVEDFAAALEGELNAIGAPCRHN